MLPTLAFLAGEVIRGTTTSRELTEACLDRIGAPNGDARVRRSRSSGRGGRRQAAPGGA